VDLGMVRASYPSVNESTTMKNTLRFTLLVLAIALPATAFGGLVGILPASVFIGSELALFFFFTAGMMLIALNDNGHGRRPIIVHRSPVSTCSATPFSPARPKISYGLRRQHCPVA
jgi:hypothetical protein